METAATIFVRIHLFNLGISPHNFIVLCSYIAKGTSSAAADVANPASFVIYTIVNAFFVFLIGNEQTSVQRSASHAEGPHGCLLL